MKVYAIDPHTGSPIHKKMYGKVWTFGEFKKNVKMANVEDVVTPIVKTSEEAEKNWNNLPVELLWIDGNHEYEFVKLDFDKWFPHLINMGTIAFHDTVFHSMPGPRKVVIDNIYKSKNFVDIGLIGGITFARKVDRNSLNDRLKNRCALLARHIYESLKPKYDLFLAFVYKYRRYFSQPTRVLSRKILKKTIKYQDGSQTKKTHYGFYYG